MPGPGIGDVVRGFNGESKMVGEPGSLRRGVGRYLQREIRYWADVSLIRKASCTTTDRIFDCTYINFALHMGALDFGWLASGERLKTR